MFLDVKQLQNILTKDAFSLFALSSSFDIDLNELQAKYLKLQKQFHPDSYILSEPEQRVLVAQISAYINQSYTSLKKPLLRGIILLQKHNILFDLAKDTILPHNFLIEQMELHEIIDEAKIASNLETLDELDAQLINTEKKLINSVSIAFKNSELTLVQELLKQLAFYNRLKNTLNAAIESVSSE